MKKQMLQARLSENGILSQCLPLGGGMELLLCERGGRILGIFAGEQSENLLWTAPALSSAEGAAELLHSTQWNIGGDRLWFGPELRYSVADRTRFWETLRTPEAIDPGNYRLTSGADCCLRQMMGLRAADGSGVTVQAQVERRISASLNPLRTAPDAAQLMQGISFGGFVQNVRVTGAGGCIEPWSLMQVVPNGTVYIPLYQPVCGTDYYEPAAPFETLTPRGVTLQATGRNRYKVGYPAYAVTGRLGYACRWNGRACLLVRSFPNAPDGIYEEEPPLRFGEKGFSVHIYNDGNQNGHGFAELECSLPAVFGAQGRADCNDEIHTWIFCGDEAKLEQIANRLLGMAEICFDGCNAERKGAKA